MKNKKTIKKINNRIITEETMLKKVSEYYSKTGKKERPTYEEILQMDKDALQTWILMRIQKPEQEKLLEEMIEHEEKTGSFGKTFREDDPPFYKLFTGLFRRTTSKKIKEMLEHMDQTLEKYGRKSDSDVVKESMMAKSIEDYYSVGRGSQQAKELIE